MERKLASIQIIKDIRPIENADKIEVSIVLDWRCVVKKNEFKIGDKCVYFEIDSLLPSDKPQFEFMRERKFRVRTIKLRGEISQGLVLKIEDCLPTRKKDMYKDYKEGMDVTNLIGVKKYEPNPEVIKVPQYNKNNILIKLFGNYIKKNKFLRKFFLRKTFKSTWPRFLIKTDEIRVQSIYSKIQKYFKDEKFYITQKLDGCSGSFYVYKNLYGICSRNIEIYNKKQKTFHGDNVYFEVEKKYDIINKLKKYQKENKINLAIQGEIIGPNVANAEKGSTGIKELDFFVFNIFDIDKRKYLDFEEMMKIINELNLKIVPIIHSEIDITNFTLESLLELSKGFYNFDDKTKIQEGIVIRSLKEKTIPFLGRFSFKVINNDFLLEYNL